MTSLTEIKLRFEIFTLDFLLYKNFTGKILSFVLFVLHIYIH